MNKLYTLAGIIGGTFFLCSYSTNPPDEHTGAPGDLLCTECHIQSNPSQNGTISLEGFPASITPHETYMLTVVNRLTEGTAVRAGFQVTVLGPFNTRAGTLKSPSPSSAISISNSRQYWDHNPAVEYPDSNVVRWNVLWEAPDMVDGSQITWYAAGNLADGNFQNIGDKIVTATGSGTIVLASTKEIDLNSPVIYPNPGTNQINIKSPDLTTTYEEIGFYNHQGIKVEEEKIFRGVVNTSAIPPGIYLLELKDNHSSHWMRWVKF